MTKKTYYIPVIAERTGIRLILATATKRPTTSPIRAANRVNCKETLATQGFLRI